jgi:hypothetical protein
MHPSLLTNAIRKGRIKHQTARMEHKMYSSLLFTSLFACSQSFDKQGTEVNVEPSNEPAAQPGEPAEEPSGEPSEPEANESDIDNDGDGFTENEGDCDDEDADLNPEDLDSDDFSTCDGDCDDVDNDIYPGADEIYYNDEDENCDPSDEYDADGDGFDSATETNNGQDCDDGNENINPDAQEDPTDGVDTDCDGVGDARFQLGYVDELCYDCAGPSGIATDSAGQVHVVYEDSGTLWYRYLQNEFGAWSTYETISTDTSRDVAYVDDSHYGLDVQVDAADYVQVAYISEGSIDTSLFYMFRDIDGEWSEEFIVDGYTADTSDDFSDTSVGYNVELAIDTNNMPVFAYFNESRYLPYLFDFTDDIVDFVTGASGIYIPLDTFGISASSSMYSGTHISLAQDSSNNTHVVYYNHNPTPFFGSIENQYTKIPDLSANSSVGLISDPLSFISNGNICWPGQSVAQDVQATHNSVAINGSSLCVAYKEENSANLHMSCKPLSGSCDTGWTTEIVDSQGSVGDFATLKFNSMGQAYIAYQDILSKELRVATKENGSWEVLVVDDAADAGAFADMTIDSNDVVHISYLEKTGGKGLLKYAWGQ